MNYLSFKLGIFSISVYSICILIGVIVSSMLILRDCKKNKIKLDDIYDLIFWTIIIGIIGARIYYVIFNLDYYLKYPIEIIKIYNGGVAIHGGIFFGIITLIIFCKKKNLNTMQLLDISSLNVLLAQAIGRWGNFFNGEAHGPEVGLSFLKKLHLPDFIINGMHINGKYYQPTFLYESFLCVVGFLIIKYISKKLKNKKDGNIFYMYLIWYGLIRFFIESLRTDSLMLYNIKMAQLVSILMIIVSSLLLIFSHKKKGKYQNEK